MHTLDTDSRGTHYDPRCAASRRHAGRLAGWPLARFHRVVACSSVSLRSTLSVEEGPTRLLVKGAGYTVWGNRTVTGSTSAAVEAPPAARRTVFSKCRSIRSEAWPRDPKGSCFASRSPIGWACLDSTSSADGRFLLVLSDEREMIHGSERPASRRRRVAAQRKRRSLDAAIRESDRIRPSGHSRPHRSSARMGRWQSAALDELMGLVYADLKRRAAGHLRREREAQLNPTVLVHEAYLRLVDQRHAAGRIEVSSSPSRRR